MKFDKMQKMHKMHINAISILPIKDKMFTSLFKKIQYKVANNPIHNVLFKLSAKKSYDAN